MQEKTRYLDVVIETKSDHVDRLFTYSCRDNSVVPGSKVIVPFRGKSTKGAYVVFIKDELPEELKDKTIKEIVSHDVELSLPSDALNVAVFMRRRYFCRLYDAIKCFLPSGMPSKTGKKRVPKFDISENEREPQLLTDEQVSCFEAIEKRLNDKDFKTFLLHGITGSGKTELYMQATEKVISEGKKVIILVPEISLTPQIVERFFSRFGAEKVAILHSKLSQGERFDEWMRIKNGEVDIAIGARSAVFAPFENIGMIIVDEEHETSYKSEMAPKYDTIEIAMKRAKRNSAICILGSATPSIVSMYRAKEGIYEYLCMKKRYNETPLPETIVADMRDELAAGNMNIFSEALYNKIADSLAKEKQTILFLNRRGYSPYIKCPKCGLALKCEECGISLTYHKKENKAVCHFCGSAKPVPKNCTSCGYDKFTYFGFGTEKVEELTKQAFPDAVVDRLDLDTVSKKGSITKILKDFGKKKTDILIGTQMVAKGLDFRNVDTVGIMSADVSLNIPDFRSAERTFQLITQASGRAGRGDEKGTVVVQSYSPEEFPIPFAITGDYERFYKDEIMLREYLSYPPFSDIVRITIEAASPELADASSKEMYDWMISYFGEEEKKNILGPIPSAITKINDAYRYSLHVKMKPQVRSRYEVGLFEYMRKNNNEKHQKCRIIIDVNSFSLM